MEFWFLNIIKGVWTMRMTKQRVASQRNGDIVETELGPN